jgi:hypothetical protein
MRETRLYYKGAHQQAYLRFETVRLAADEALLKRFVFVFLLAVEILGHIFEQSITDLERLRENLEKCEGAPTFLSAKRGVAPEADKNVGAPQAREPSVGRRRKQHQAEAAGTARKTLSGPNA